MFRPLKEIMIEIHAQPAAVNKISKVSKLIFETTSNKVTTCKKNWEFR